ncbi:hypothetical protein O9992_01160 [Vibrio lentus]|nr:hypothetical protein [Vibrio lentus]
MNGDFSFEVAAVISTTRSETIVKQFSFLAEDGGWVLGYNQHSELAHWTAKIQSLIWFRLSFPLETNSTMDLPRGSAVSATETITFTAGSDDVVKFELNN